MFGYVTPYREELKVRDYEIFKAYYCGLCKSLGKEFNTGTRFGLNYDLNFLGILLSSLDTTRDKAKKEGCFANPFKKKKIMNSNKYIDYSASISIMLVYFKLIDDWRDDKSLKSLLVTPVYYFPLKKAKKLYSDKYSHIEKYLNMLVDLENNNCDVVDEVADAFGKIMEGIFTPSFVEIEETRRILKWLGYNLGRWIYILDAFNDLEEDIKNGSYNPILLQYDYKADEEIHDFVHRIKNKIEFSLIFTLDNIAKSFELLDIKHNREILDNIIYMGTRRKMEQIFKKWEVKKYEKSI